MKTEKPKKPKKYCTNKEMLKELIKFKKTGTMSEELGGMFIEIATRFSNRSDWAGYPFHVKEDFIGDAILRMVTQAHKFDVERENANPFAYFSQVVYHMFVMQVKKHYKNINIQRMMCEKYLEEIECSEYMSSDGVLKKILQDRVEELD